MRGSGGLTDRNVSSAPGEQHDALVQRSGQHDPLGGEPAVGRALRRHGPATQRAARGGVRLPARARHVPGPVTRGVTLHDRCRCRRGRGAAVSQAKT